MSSTTAKNPTASGNEVYRQTTDSGTMAYESSILSVSFRTARCVMNMNESRIKALRQRRYSEVNESQQERNQERVSHVADLLSELEGRIENDTGRLETAKELLSVAGSETRTEGCSIVLRHCLKLLRDSAEDSGHTEYYREHMREMPDETVSESPSVKKYCFADREKESRGREPVERGE